ncbi:MAG: hypothetical protein LUE98_12825 [Tannerellaceae bacterium]|nr:hypothetical protein [Tannerellaceae bacterium]
MVSKYGYAKVILFLFILLAGCTTKEHAGLSVSIEEVPVPDSVQFVHGDVICRLGNGYFSNYFRKCSTTEKIYSHVGIIEVAAGSVFVIHAEASELTGVGKVKREPLNYFLHTIHTWGLYRITPDQDTCRMIVEKALAYYLAGTPFDLDFNNDDDSQVYCTELVAHSINKVYNHPVIIPHFSFAGEKMFGIDDIYLHSGFRKIYMVSNK